MESLRVALGARSYPIHIGSGLLDRPEVYRPAIGAGRVAVVTNAVVAPLYLGRLRRALEAAGAPDPVEVVVEDGEAAKRWPVLDSIHDALLAGGCGRDSCIMALGGGVVGDLAGFAAATYQRGVPFVQVPTTLLAQVDSSVGGKTAINHARGKNMVGAFHQPAAVVSDVETLGTLPLRELRAGLAEVIKHGLALDAPFFDWIERNVERLLARDPEALAYAVRRSCELKAAVVAADEREAGERALLNLGHTFGHAIEAGTGYGQWLHGEAVAAGMVMAADLSVRLGGIPQAEAGRLRRVLERTGLPVQGPPLSVATYRRLMAVDKKAAGGRVRFVVLERIGGARTEAGVGDAELSATLEACTSAAPQ